MTPLTEDASGDGARTFVLLPGAWSGPWCWEPVQNRLEERGHVVHPVTFTGLQPDDDVNSVDIEAHVHDVLSSIERNGLSDVILVGHSYSGLVAGLVADRAPQHVARTVYVQAFLPVNGRSLLNAFPEEQRSQELLDIEAHGGWWPPPPAAAISGEPDLSMQQVRWLAERMVPHPGRTVSEPVSLSGSLAGQPSTYIASDLAGEELRGLRGRPTWRLCRIEAGHWPMVTIPDELTQILIDCASHGGPPG